MKEYEMKSKAEKSIEWQHTGGTLEIPDGWFVDKVDFDAKEPYCQIIEKTNIMSDGKIILIPKSLAYYLSTHFCGSEVMHESIQEDMRRTIKHTIKEALGL